MPRAKRKSARLTSPPHPAIAAPPAQHIPPALSPFPSELIGSVCESLRLSSCHDDLARLMRVNKEWHDVAAPYLYDVLDVDTSNIHDVVRGLSTELRAGLPAAKGKKDAEGKKVGKEKRGRDGEVRKGECTTEQLEAKGSKRKQQKASSSYRTDTTKGIRKVVSLSYVREIIIRGQPPHERLGQWVLARKADGTFGALETIRFCGKEMLTLSDIRVQANDESTNTGPTIRCCVSTHRLDRPWVTGVHELDRGAVDVLAANYMSSQAAVALPLSSKLEIFNWWPIDLPEEVNHVSYYLSDPDAEDQDGGYSYRDDDQDWEQTVDDLYTVLFGLAGSRRDSAGTDTAWQTTHSLTVEIVCPADHAGRTQDHDGARSESLVDFWDDPRLNICTGADLAAHFVELGIIEHISPNSATDSGGTARKGGMLAHGHDVPAETPAREAGRRGIGLSDNDVEVVFRNRQQAVPCSACGRPTGLPAPRRGALPDEPVLRQDGVTGRYILVEDAVGPRGCVDDSDSYDDDNDDDAS